MVEVKQTHQEEEGDKQLSNDRQEHLLFGDFSGQKQVDVEYDQGIMMMLAFIIPQRFLLVNKPGLKIFMVVGRGPSF